MSAVFSDHPHDLPIDFSADQQVAQLRVPPHSIEAESSVLGGLLLGIIEALGAGYIGDLTGGFLGSHYQDVFAFFVLICVLVFRPSGLLGERLAERA